MRPNRSSSGAYPAKSGGTISGVCPVTGNNHGSARQGSTGNAEEQSTDPQIVPAKCPFGYDSGTFKLGPLSCMVCQALLHECSRCRPCSYKFCKCSLYIEGIEPDSELEALVDRFVDGHARIKRSHAAGEALGGKNKVIYEDVSMERGAVLVQQAMRAFRGQNFGSAKSRLAAMCAEDIREELKFPEDNLDLRSQLGVVLGVLGDCCRTLGDASSATTYYEESAEFLSKLPAKDLELVHSLSVSLNKIGDLLKEHSAVSSQVIDLATSLAKVADVDRNIGNESTAVEGFEEANECLEKLKLGSEQASLEQRRLSVLDFRLNQLGHK
ncbi:hypothetical protein BS78_05G057500 [Paspalum vaginatum]|nr:hypothetical protein BS78_05G057500 [Paspalum vaginatum]